LIRPTVYPWENAYPFATTEDIIRTSAKKIKRTGGSSGSGVLTRALVVRYKALAGTWSVSAGQAYLTKNSI
jgi:hypothetical protein